MTDQYNKRRDLSVQENNKQDSDLKKFRTSPDTVPYEVEEEDIHTDDAYFVDSPKNIEVATDEDTTRKG